MRTLDRVFGAAERKERLTEDVIMFEKDYQSHTNKAGVVANAVYRYEVQLSTPRMNITEQESIDADNAVKIMFIKYGEQCLDECFFAEKLKAEYPELKIENVRIVSVEKFYKETFRRGRMGICETCSRMYILDVKKEHVDTV